MKKRIIKRTFSFVMALAMIVGYMKIFPSLEVDAWKGGGIYNNGLSGITINIYSEPFTTFSNYTWGQYAYSKNGCAWFASARVNQLTGKGNVIRAGENWINNANSYGFSVVDTPRANSIICWSGHVAILEKIEGNTAYISEGGYYSSIVDYSSNDYCMISTCDISNIKNRFNGLNGDFYGYVYFGDYVNPQPSSPAPTEATITTDTTKYILGDTVYLHAFSNNNPLTYIFCIYKGGKRVKEVNTGSNPLAAFSSNDLGVGNYSVYVFCANNAGYKDSQYIDFEIVYPAPTEASITTDTSRYILGDTVYLHAFANKYIFCIYQNGTRIKEIDTNDNNTASFPSSELGVGEYSAYVFCANSVSYKDSDYIDFEIVYPAPTEAVIYSNKQTYSLTDDIVLNATANNHPSTYIFCIYKDGKRIKEYNTGDNSQVEFNASELGIGEYSVYVFCANKISYKDSDYISFNIVENKCEGGHSFGSWITKEASTCSQAGVEYRSCTVCKKIETRNLEKKPHVYSMYETPATCTTDGVKTFTCTACNDSYTETIKASGHKYVTTVVPPTCTEKGYTLHKCSVCGDEYKDTATNATGHKYTSKVTKPATCTTDGVKTFTCTACKDSYTEPIKSTGHKYVTTVVPPTCTEKGYTLHKCSICGDEYKDNETSAQGHKYTSSVTKKASCTEDGTMTYTCDCGDSYTETIKAAGHKYETTTVPPTDTEAGYDEHICSVCGDNYKDNLIPANGHSYTSEITKPASCTEDGLKTFTCTSCGDTYTEIIKATGHEYVSTIIPPDCTSDGYTVHICKKCNDSYTDERIKATGHKYVDTVIAPTTTEQGCTHHKCSDCGDEYDDSFVDPIQEEPITFDIILNANDKTMSSENVNISINGEEASTSENGSAELSLADGTHEITFSAHGFVPRTYTVEVKNGKLTEELTPELNLIGDADGNGVVNTLDIVKLKRHLIKVEPLKGYALDCANTDGNDTLNTLDIVKLKRHLINVEKLW